MIDNTDTIHGALHHAMHVAGLGQEELDTINRAILAADEAGACWHERAALYWEEALLFQRQAELAAAVAGLAMQMAATEDGAGAAS